MSVYDNVCCMFCVGHVGSTNHLFVLCEVHSIIWYRGFRWEEKPGPFPHFNFRGVRVVSRPRSWETGVFRPGLDLKFSGMDDSKNE